MLLHVLLGGEEDRTVRAGDLNLGHTVHWLHVLKVVYGAECVSSTLHCEDAVNSLLISLGRPGESNFGWRNSTQSWEDLECRSWYSLVAA